MSEVKILSKEKSDTAFSLQVWGGKSKVVVVRGCGGREEGRVSTISSADFDRLKGNAMFGILIKSGRFSVVDGDASTEKKEAAPAPAPAATDAATDAAPEQPKDGEAQKPEQDSAPAHEQANGGETGDLFDGDKPAAEKEEAAPAAPKRKRYTGLKASRKDANAEPSAEAAK